MHSNEERHHELVVIGAGQMRTGTTTLKIALEKLYGEQCYHMDEVIHKNQNHIKIWNEILDRGSLDEEQAKILFKDFCAAVDNPAATFYKDLMKIYPNCKVILTTRNSNDWVKSMRSTIIRKPALFWDSFKRISLWSYGMVGFGEMCEKLEWKSFHQSNHVLKHDDEILKSSFESYNEDVRKTVPPERLLEFNAKDGWEPLCKFLNVPMPNEPFPFANNTSDYQKIYRKIHMRFLLKCGSALFFILGYSIFMYNNWTN